MHVLDATPTWWRPEPITSRPSGSQGSVAFGALVTFTAILLLSPQAWFPVLQHFRIAFLAAGFAIVMYLLFLPLSFLIPSTSGLATVAMPIMAPLADFAGVNRALVVTAYQSASGLVNLVTPTSAVVMGGLAIARVPYGTFLRFVWPLLIALAGLTVVVLAVGTVAT